MSKPKSLKKWQELAKQGVLFIGDEQIREVVGFDGTNVFTSGRWIWKTRIEIRRGKKKSKSERALDLLETMQGCCLIHYRGLWRVGRTDIEIFHPDHYDWYRTPYKAVKKALKKQ